MCGRIYVCKLDIILVCIMIILDDSKIIYLDIVFRKLYVVDEVFN